MFAKSHMHKAMNFCVPIPQKVSGFTTLKILLTLVPRYRSQVEWALIEYKKQDVLNVPQ